MASLLERKSLPLTESSINSVIQSEIRNCRSLEDFAHLLKGWSRKEAGDFGRLTIPVQVGGAYRLAEKGGLFGIGTDQASRQKSKLAREKFATDAEYSLSHLRSCGRLYDDCLEIERSSRFWGAHGGELTRRPRKREGIEFRLSVIKAWKAYRDARQIEKLEHDAAIDKANGTLPKEKFATKPVISSRDLAKRKDAVIIALFGMVKAILAGLSITQDRAILFDEWLTPRAIFDQMNASEFGEDEDGLCERLADLRSAQPDVIMVDALDFFRHANDAWASPDDGEDGEEDTGDGGGGPPPGPTGEPSPATGAAMPARMHSKIASDPPRKRAGRPKGSRNKPREPQQGQG